MKKTLINMTVILVIISVFTGASFFENSTAEKGTLYTNWQIEVIVKDLGGTVVEGALVYLWGTGGNCPKEDRPQCMDSPCQGDPIASGTSNVNGICNFNVQTSSSCFCGWAIGNKKYCGWSCDQCQFDPNTNKFTFVITLIPF
jgi:hypothetical protein